MSFDRGPLRSGQVVVPFGPGAMLMDREGVSLIGCGLDHWYEYESAPPDGEMISVQEFKIEEWRLQRMLMMNHFRIPPDYRERTRRVNNPNSNITLPYLRFPTWHICPFCFYLNKLPMTQTDPYYCPRCQRERDWKIKVQQVPFIAVCTNGHLQEFPFSEWVHASCNSRCNQEMRLLSSGGASLGAQKIVCDCGESRSLAWVMNTTETTEDHTYLSTNLDRREDEIYYCQGCHPWHGDLEHSSCDQHLRTVLVSSSNVYYPHIVSSIYLPAEEQTAPEALLEILRAPEKGATILNLISSAMPNTSADEIIKQLRATPVAAYLQPYSDHDLRAALAVVLEGDDKRAEEFKSESSDRGVRFRHQEYRILRDNRKEHNLTITLSDLGNYSDFMQMYFQRISLVQRLRETRVLAGFSRINPDPPKDRNQLQAMMWKNPDGHDWLPAHIVHGEGIFLEFNIRRLEEWEKRPEVVARIQPVKRAMEQIPRAYVPETDLTPRFFLIHTFAHILIGRLIFECGYATASLRERLYVSHDPEAPMAGVLIYTAAGDSEGTLGGLVRMGEPGYLEPTLLRAIEKARWCSTDPVCMESGAVGGQGPDSCNLAACHGCALLPETSCEYFNRFLDRGVIVGGITEPQLGYFSNIDCLDV
jgi:MrfA Zn-binding domain